MEGFRKERRAIENGVVWGVLKEKIKKEMMEKSGGSGEVFKER